MTTPIERVYRAEFPRAVATVARIVGDVGLAEDAVQQAFADALRAWPIRGRPDNPGAWITTAARNRALDRLRREASRDAKESDANRVAPPEVEPDLSPLPDDQLRMIFTCCHPALSPESQVALTLRLVCGLRTSEIARAFMQSEATVAQRLSRAKTKIRQAHVPLRVPPANLLPERTPQVLACIYLVFSEGYFATAGSNAIRDELCSDAIYLGRLMCELMPEESEAHALLALMLLDDSRRAQRSRSDELVPLEEQDRSRWDHAMIAEGMGCLLSAARRLGGGQVRIWHRPRLLRHMQVRRAGNAPTGASLSVRTTTCCNSPTHPPCGSIELSRWAFETASTRDWSCSTRLPMIHDLPTGTRCWQLEQTCCVGSEG
jgi:RNA polymerase sigma-70 factor, ECF subfamily